MNDSHQLCLTALIVCSLALPVTAAGAEGTTTTTKDPAATTLLESDLSLLLFVFGDDDKEKRLPEADADSYFNQTRCRCAAPVIFRAVLNQTGIEKLKGESVAAEMWWGNDCDSSEGQKSCERLGDGQLGQGKKQIEGRSSVDVMFERANPRADDACAGFEGSRSLWLLLRKDAKQSGLTVSRLLRLDAKPPAAPKLTATKSGDGALALTWTGSATTDVVAYQALCSPKPAKPFKAEFASCTSPDAEDDGGTGVVPCTGRIEAGVTTTRVEGLANETAYEVALVAVDESGNVSEASNRQTGTPAPTTDFIDEYIDAGGVAQGGCTFAGPRGRGTWWGFAGFVALLWTLRRLRRWWMRVAVTWALFVFVMAPPAAHAQLDTGVMSTGSGGIESPRTHTLSFGVGFYRPGIDSEFAARDKKPFAKVFSGERRPLWQVRLERFVWQGFGSLSVGMAAGYYNATGRALVGETQEESADQTSFQIIPLVADVTYRFDPWRRTGFPLAPHARVGLDYSLWSASTAGDVRERGATAGWHAAAGLALYLDGLDRESAVTLDRDAGVNGTRLFVEVNRADISGLGRNRRLTLSDTTVSVGLALEL